MPKEDPNPLLDLAKQALHAFDPDSVRAEVVGEGMFRVRQGDIDLVVGVRNGHAAAGIVREASQLANVLINISEALNKATTPTPEQPK